MLALIASNCQSLMQGSSFKARRNQPLNASSWDSNFFLMDWLFDYCCVKGKKIRLNKIWYFKMCIGQTVYFLMSALGVLIKQSNIHVITRYQICKNAIWWTILNAIFITLANHTSPVKSASPQGCYYWLILAIKSLFSVPNKQQMVRGSLMALTLVIAKYTHKHVTEVQSPGGSSETEEIKCLSTSATWLQHQMEVRLSHCLLSKSSKIKICCYELMFVNLLHSPLQLKTPSTQISVILSIL